MILFVKPVDNSHVKETKNFIRCSLVSDVVFVIKLENADSQSSDLATLSLLLVLKLTQGSCIN